MKYPSAIDTWLAAILIGAPLLVIGNGIFTLSKSTSAGLILIGVGLTISIIMALFAFPCYYIIGDCSVKIKCGIIEEDLPLEKIQLVEKSSSFLSAPALSLRRVKISLDDGFRLVSPKDRDGFIEILKQKIQK